MKITSRKERTFSPRQLKISSKQQVQELDSQTAAQGPTASKAQEDGTEPRVSKKRSETG